MSYLLIIVVSYLIGSIPFGYLIVRAKAGADVRESGSGGTGATNVSRRAGKVAGVLTLVLDALKGATAVFVAGVVLTKVGPERDWVLAAAATAAIVGHIFPVWLGFRGGKGVATGVGAFLMLAPVAVLCAGVVFIAVFLPTRYVSLASMMAALMLPVCVWLQSVFVSPVGDARPMVVGTLAGAALIVFAHRGNIGRLWNGTESRFK